MSITAAAPLTNSSSGPIRSRPAIESGPAASPSTEIGSKNLVDEAVAISDETRAPGISNNENKENSPLDSNQSSDGDRVEISDSAKTRRNAEAAREKEAEAEDDPTELSESEKDLVDRLKARDVEVRAHEQAHLSAAGDLANGPPKYDYQTGPDGRRYAIGGSVSIDVSPESDPQETIDKAERIKRSALAPAEPSGKDRQVAAKADAMKVQAQQELAKEKLEKQTEGQEQEGSATGITDNSQTEEDRPGIGPADDGQRPGFAANGSFGGQQSGQIPGFGPQSESGIPGLGGQTAGIPGFTTGQQDSGPRIPGFTSGQQDSGPAGLGRSRDSSGTYNPLGRNNAAPSGSSFSLIT